jgi:hypothetical protein
MKIETLAREAANVLETMPYDMGYQHGFEVAEGFFTLHNDFTGQSKTVVYHPESGYVFKFQYLDCEPAPAKASNRYLGEIEIDGTTYRVRLPIFHHFPHDDEQFIAVQEFVGGEPCTCVEAHCTHTRRLATVTNCYDAHRGNWKIYNGEVVLFDFEGITL